MAFVKERFVLNQATKDHILNQTPKFDFGFFGEAVFYRTYSRVVNGKNESWNNVVIRVIEGTFSIRKDHYIKNHIHWDEPFWQHYASNMAQMLFDMKWMPPGRGLWAMGTDFIYERGSMALNNCAFITLSDNLGTDIAWLMDVLMCGVGAGFTPERNDDFKVYHPVGEYTFVIQDTRESWCASVKALIDAWLTGGARPVFDYSKVRGPNLPIKGFGGISSGPDPLKLLHLNIDQSMIMFESEQIDVVELKTNLANATGYTVVAGNVRRSAELACAPITDKTFLDLKDYSKKPYRASYGHLSNNSVLLEHDSDFEMLREVADRVVANGEPGIINVLNLKKGRIGKEDGLREDKAVGFNPCAEQPLESHELCTLAETCPTKCNSIQEWLKSCEYATFYASTVTLLLTHSSQTNAVMCRNRRIGVSLIDVANWRVDLGTSRLIRALRNGYKTVRETNNWLNDEAGVPRAIRNTTVKPGGTVPKIVGRPSGWNVPNFRHMIRRMNVASDSRFGQLLKDAGVPWEKSIYSMNTDVFEFPLHIKGDCKTSSETTIWEQASVLTMLQSEWSDNAVSNTVTFKTSEIPDIEPMLASICPYIKSVSLLRLAEGSDTVYPQSPEEGITEEEYNRRAAVIKPIDWTQLNEDAVGEKYCQGDKCELPVTMKV